MGSSCVLAETRQRVMNVIVVRLVGEGLERKGGG